MKISHCCAAFSVSQHDPLGWEETLKYFMQLCEAAGKETSSFLISLFLEFNHKKRHFYGSRLWFGPFCIHPRRVTEL